MLNLVSFNKIFLVQSVSGKPVFALVKILKWFTKLVNHLQILTNEKTGLPETARTKKRNLEHFIMIFLVQSVSAKQGLPETARTKKMGNLEIFNTTFLAQSVSGKPGLPETIRSAVYLLYICETIKTEFAFFCLYFLILRSFFLLKLACQVGDSRPVEVALKFYKVRFDNYYCARQGIKSLRKSD